MTIRILCCFAAFGVSLSWAQPAPPNSVGVSLGHVHLNVHDIDTQEKFLAQLGGRPVQNGKLRMVQFPGIFVVLHSQDPTGGLSGSAVDQFGFRVKNLKEWLAKWRADNIKIERGANRGQVFVFGPDDIRIEMIEDRSILVPVAMDEIHYHVPDPPAAQAWYVKTFGAVAGKSDGNLTAVFPGGAIVISKSESNLAPNKGRLIDRFGFEIKDLEQFTKKIEAWGIVPQAPGIRAGTNAPSVRVAFITDPWSTGIELTQGLNPSQSPEATTHVETSK